VTTRIHQAARALIETTRLAPARPVEALQRVFDYTKLPWLHSRISAAGRRNAVFIWIPKNAGTSVWTALRRPPKLLNVSRVRHRFAQRGLVTFGHMDYAGLRNRGFISEEFDRTAFKFCFTRNPFDRAVSLFKYLKSSRKKIPEHWTFLDFCRHLRGNPVDPIGLYNVCKLSQCNPQVRWIENVEFDFIGKQENLDQDLSAVAEWIEMKRDPLKRLNSSSRSGSGSYYCDESLDIVRDLYREDFELLEYDASTEIH
jgi:hypothetical protein